MPYLERTGQPRLHYEIDDYTDPWRESPYILLQHGYARSSKFWRAWVPYLSRFFKIIRPDLRGLGQSSAAFSLDDGISLENYLTDLTDLLDHLGIDSVHYCGESSAGTLGLAFAAERPSRVRTLTVISAPVSMTEEDKQSALGGYPNRIEALRALGSRGWLEASNAGRRFPADSEPALLQWTLDQMARSDVEVLVAMFRFVSTVDTEPLLQKIEAPVLALYPKPSVITKDEHLDKLQRGVRNLRLVRVPLQAHSLQIVAPALCAGHVLHFAGQFDGLACREL
jgi:3-oxoadipate enol-lactonase